MLSARFELAIFRVSGERIDQLSHESELSEQLGCRGWIQVYMYMRGSSLILHLFTAWLPCLAEPDL